MSGDRYFIQDQNGTYFLTFTVVDWLDVFIRESYKQIITHDLNYCIQNKGLEVFCWCLMTNHLHLIVRAKQGFKLSETIRDFKKHVTKTVIEKIKAEPESRKEDLLWHFERAGKLDSRITTYKFWQEDNHAVYLLPTSAEMMREKMNYIHNNPVKDGIVHLPHDYLYSSARDYAGLKGLVNVSLV